MCVVAVVEGEEEMVNREAEVDGEPVGGIECLRSGRMGVQIDVDNRDDETQVESRSLRVIRHDV